MRMAMPPACVGMPLLPIVIEPRIVIVRRTVIVPRIVIVLPMAVMLPLPPITSTAHVRPRRAPVLVDPTPRSDFPARPAPASRPALAFPPGTGLRAPEAGLVSPAALARRACRSAGPAASRALCVACERACSTSAIT